MTVTTKTVLKVESELGKTLAEIFEPIAAGKLLPITTALVMMKHATGKSEDECINEIDANEGTLLKVIQAYSKWSEKAYSIAEAGN